MGRAGRIGVALRSGSGSGGVVECEAGFGAERGVECVAEGVARCGAECGRGA